ncbi:hypothetical protein TWF679_004568 [Orbilia oligospora]|uniref:HMA domain-containing protein n=1 Tax=Orbilia oligospora TaxID=2813651 RepID=A0A8H8UPZ9_ORBOL|nr:hypothetical protein TWF679_004568 [Orbilia oligospora]
MEKGMEEKMKEDSVLLFKTTLFISNIHCPTCTDLIQSTLASLTPPPASHNASVLSNRVEVFHSPLLPPQKIIKALNLVGFDIESCLSSSGGDEESQRVAAQRSPYLLEGLGGNLIRKMESKKRKRHEELCGQCRSEKAGATSPSPYGSTEAIARPIPLHTKLYGDAHASNTTSGAGSPTVERRQPLPSPLGAVSAKDSDDEKWLATLAIQGMTCSACVNSIRQNLRAFGFIEKAEISALTHSGNIVFFGKHNMDTIVEAIEDGGYDVEVVDLTPFNPNEYETRERTMTLQVNGLYCPKCPPKIMEAVENFASSQVTIVKPITSPRVPEITIKYTPQPDITARKLIEKIESVDPAFKVIVKPSQSLEDRSALVHKAEVRRIGVRLLLSVICAIPAFIIGIVFMALLPKDNKYRVWSEKPIWSGTANVSEWSLLIISTPVYFFAADLFHVRAYQEMRGLWSRKNPKPVWKKFMKFGSMNLLMSLGTTVAYFSSIALLTINAAQQPEATDLGHHGMQMQAEMKKSEIAHATYFDAVVFLTMFLLFGRLLESYSKAKSANAVSLLGNLRPKEARLLMNPTSTETTTVPVELLEVGDHVVVAHGQSPPLDGRVITGSGQFDESALTGESRLVTKTTGEEVFAGTVNQGQPTTVEIQSISGKSMLDNIVRIVREGQVQRAPIERVADLITGYFVPVVSYLAVLTWVIWLSLGYSGAIPSEWVEGNQGGWAVWSMSFAIAVFVIACPCGIGLAAPTALFIGTGLAARYGILAKGGGEAFQEASWLDAVVFDKTGTLTHGGEPEVGDAVIVGYNEEEKEWAWGRTVLGIAEGLESASGHPLAKAVLKHVKAEGGENVERLTVEEIPGRGVTGTFKIHGVEVEAFIGNEAFMHEEGVVISQQVKNTLEKWKQEAKSVIVLAAEKKFDGPAPSGLEIGETPTVLAYFSVSDQIRPEAGYVISELEKMGINIYMITGDNATTASAVAKTVGIPAENVIAGVLPHEKAEQVKYLQQTAQLRRHTGLAAFFHRKRSVTNANTRPRVAMVGDGINDSPALVTADVGIAIGSGSDIALSAASFILLREDLRQVLVLMELARKVIRRVKFNFFWAAIYNVIGIPIAAGVLYGYKRTRLDPSWAALAMAGSSVSVVASSLLLRSRIRGLGFRIKRNWRSKE